MFESNFFLKNLIFIRSQLNYLINKNIKNKNTKVKIFINKSVEN